MKLTSEESVLMLRDEKAERLESQCFWRRAATRWLEYMMTCLTDAEREQVRIRRNRCLSNLQKSGPEKRYDVTEIRLAADTTLKKMGIDQPGGKIFRKHGESRLPLRLDAFLTRLSDEKEEY